MSYTPTTDEVEHRYAYSVQAALDHADQIERGE